MIISRPTIKPKEYEAMFIEEVETWLSRDLIEELNIKNTNSYAKDHF